MTTTIQKSVLAVAAEAEEGTAETLVLADTIETLVAPALSPDLESIDREVAGGSLSEQESVPGRASGTMEIPMELAGPSDGSPLTLPTWALLARGAGMKVTATKAVQVASISTPGDSPANAFRHGESVTFAPSGATGKVVGHYDGNLKHDGTGVKMTWIFVEELTGTIDSADTTITGSIGTATVATLVASDNGLRDAKSYTPFDLAIESVVTGAVSGGPFVHGELVTAAGAGESGARGQIWAPDGVSIAASPITIERWLGSPAFLSGDVLTGATSGATATASANGTALEVPSLTMEQQLPGVGRSLVGARGAWSTTLENGAAAGLTFNFLGKHPQPYEAVPFSGAPASRNARPPKVTGSQVLFDGSHTPCFSSFTLGNEGTPTLRECLPEAEGFESALITARQIRGSIDPEAISEGLYPLLGRAWDKTPFVFEMIVGQVAAQDGNAFVLRMPRAQGLGYTPGDRERIPTNTVPLKAAAVFDGAGREDEVAIHAF